MYYQIIILILWLIKLIPYSYPRRKLQFERRPSTRYARRQSHLIKEKESINQASKESYEIDTNDTRFINNKYSSCHELRVLPINSRITQNIGIPAVTSPVPAVSSPIPLNVITQAQGIGLPSTLPLSPAGYHTRSIVDIISEFNEKNQNLSDQSKVPNAPDISITRDIDYLKWVSETKCPSKLTPTDSCSSGKSGSSSNSGSEKEKHRASSPDSGCDVSVMVAYTSEPKVRRVDSSSQSVPTPAPRQSLRKHKTGKEKPKSILVTEIEHPEKVSILTKEALAEIPDCRVTRNSSYELNCPYSRTAIYSLEGSRLQEQMEQDGSDSGHGSSILSNTSRLRSYASSRDILEMYGTGAGQPLTPRMLGFSSSDLRLPPSALLLSLSGKKSNSSMSVHWAQPPKSAVYQNIPRRLERDTVF